MIRMIQKNMNKKGFTLVELIIVIAVMAILAAIVIPRMSGITATFRTRADLRSTETIARQLQVKGHLGDLTVNVTTGTYDPVTAIVLGTTDALPAARTANNEFYYLYSGGELIVKCTADETVAASATNSFTLNAALIE